MTDPATLSDAQARDAALDPRHSFIVQAPAGSGKTELLTQRYLTLLATVEQPEQILAITFTRKAASEMRNRILQSLTRARTTPRPAKEHEAKNWDLAQAALSRDREHRWQVETHPSRLRIQTLDALNSSLARRMPVLAGLGANMDIAPDARAIYEAVCERLLTRLGESGEVAQHLEIVLRHLANRVTEFVDLMCDLLACRDHWLRWVVQRRDDDGLRASIERTLQAVIEHHLERLRRLFPADMHAELTELCAFAAGNLLQEGDGRRGLESIAVSSSLPDTSANSVEQWRTLASLLCKKDGEHLKDELYASVDKRHGFPADKDKKSLKERMKTLLRDLSAIDELPGALAGVMALPEARFSDAQWRVLAALLQLLPHAVSELMAEFQSRGQVDYVEMASRAIRAMGTEDEPTDTALTLDARLQHILIDEFQDTSTTQMELLRLLTAGWSDGDGRTLFCVGDPMQSIYRFRQAEVGLFLQLQGDGVSGVHLHPLKLQTNFRSTQPIVNWVNRHFPHIMPSDDDAELGAVRYSLSDARPDAAATGVVQWHAAVNRSPQQEAIEVSTLVQQALAADATQRIAILVTGRSQVGSIAQEFKTAGIAFNAVEIERLKNKPLIQDLIALTRALVHVGDRTAWLACLRAPWCGLTLKVLHTLVASDAGATVVELLNRAIADSAPEPSSLPLEMRVRLNRFTDVMNRALAERARHALRDWVESTWLSLNGPACLRNVSELEDAQSFFARLDELEEAGDLADTTRLEAQLEKLYANGGDSATARVEIMTIHKSKGLEFDVVVLPSMQRAGAQDGSRLLRWAQLTGLDAEGLIIAPPAAKGEDRDAIYQWLADLEKQRAHYERQRLFYVAATRAKRELHLFASATTNADGSVRKPTKGTLLALLWNQVQAEFAALPTQSIHDIPQPVASSMALRRMPLDWQPPPAAPAVSGHVGNPLINAENNIEFDWAGEVARHIGTVVHAELERLVKLPRTEMSQWQATQRRPALLLQLAELGVPQALRERAYERVAAAVEHMLKDSRGRWILGIDAAHADAAAEIALTGVINGTLVNVVIDRSVVDEYGTRWIIDFKTSLHEGGGREDFLRSEEQRYRPQLERYARLMRAYRPAEPIRMALYFPLMGEWREL